MTFGECRGLLDSEASCCAGAISSPLTPPQLSVRGVGGSMAGWLRRTIKLLGIGSRRKGLGIGDDSLLAQRAMIAGRVAHERRRATPLAGEFAAARGGGELAGDGAACGFAARLARAICSRTLLGRTLGQRIKRGAAMLRGQRLLCWNTFIGVSAQRGTLWKSSGGGPAGAISPGVTRACRDGRSRRSARRSTCGYGRGDRGLLRPRLASKTSAAARWAHRFHAGGRYRLRASAAGRFLVKHRRSSGEPRPAESGVKPPAGSAPRLSIDLITAVV